MKTPVLAAADGVVIYANNGLKGYGNTILIRHDNELVTVYAHVGELLVKRGDQVSVGDINSSTSRA